MVLFADYTSEDEAADKFPELLEELSSLRAVAKKVIDCFPERIEEDEKFNIPAYIIEELREALKERNNETNDS